jgi:hypothetical protein
MPTPEAEALVISTDPLHVRFQIKPNNHPHLFNGVACKSDTGVVSVVLPGKFLNQTSSIQST